MQRAQDPLAAVLPDMAEVGAPAQFEDELVLHVQRLARGNAGQHVSQRDQAVGDVGRQAADAPSSALRVRA